MIGDFFGGTFLENVIVIDEELDNQTGPSALLPGTVSLAGADRRFKVAENVSPIPRDRIFFNFNHFRNALVDINRQQQSLNRFTFGFEKTFLEGLGSIETRLPLADGLNSRQVRDLADQTASEWGNLAIAFKLNLLSGSNYIIVGGASMTFPTGDDFELIDFAGQTEPAVRIKNEAIHLAPYIGGLIQGDQYFLQGFIQTDFDLEGNAVFRHSFFEGRLQDQNLLFIDAALGRWLYRDPNQIVSGICAIGELHYTSTINDTDEVAGFTNPHNRMDILNATAAVHFQLGLTTCRIGGTAPLRSGAEELFDGEFLVQLGRQF
jgi:hypothetical protein